MKKQHKKETQLKNLNVSIEKKYFKDGKEVNTKYCSRVTKNLKNYFNVDIETRKYDINKKDFVKKTLKEYLQDVDVAKKKLKTDFENKNISKEDYNECLDSIDKIVNWHTKDKKNIRSTFSNSPVSFKERCSKQLTFKKEPTSRETYYEISQELEKILKIEIFKSRTYTYYENGQKKFVHCKKTYDEICDEEFIAFQKLEKLFKEKQITKQEKIDISKKIDYIFSNMKKSAPKIRKQETIDKLNKIFNKENNKKIDNKSNLHIEK